MNCAVLQGSTDHVFIYLLLVGRWLPLSVQYKRKENNGPQNATKNTETELVTEMTCSIFFCISKIMQKILEVKNHIKE